MKAKPNEPLKAEKYINLLGNIETVKRTGRVSRIIGLVIESAGPSTSIGDLCRIYSSDGKTVIPAEVVGFKEDYTLLMPLGTLHGIGPGCRVESTGTSFKIGVGSGLLGRVIDALGNPIDGKGPLNLDDYKPIYNQPPNPMSRKRISDPIETGIKAIDAILTCGKGQRMGIFSGSGVGKSVLLGMIARYTSADINVIGLIGERGREVREFIEKDLGEEGLARSVVVVATSDQPSLLRKQGALVTTTIAEHFRDLGNDVMLMMDSVTRFATAQREIGLAIGEPPATKGFTPSVFDIIPKLLERSGTCDSDGSITGLYTVLVDADDFNEPVSDTVRATLDGHIWLSRDLAARNHYPSIDVLQSVSRVMVDIVPQEHMDLAQQLKEMVAVYRQSEDLINIGAYTHGSNPKIDTALSKIENINQFLRQLIGESSNYDLTYQGLASIFNGSEQK
jgi:flagellum-specific ATP synthase